MSRKGENIYKRKDGRWEARYIAYYEESGRAHYKSLYAKSYTEAKRKKQKACQLAPVKETPAGRLGGSFGEVCMCWLDHVRPQLKESSYVKYRNILESYVMPVLGDCRMPQIQTGLLERYFDGLLEHGKSDGTGLSAKSVSDIKSVLKRILMFSAKEGWMKECRIDHIVIKQDSRQIRILTRQEQADLEACLLADFSNIHMGIYVSLYTGIRLGELCALRWESVSLEKKMIFINRTMMRIRDYSHVTDKNTKIIETPPKSVCAIREIPIPDFLLRILREKSVGMLGQEYFLTGRADQYMEPRLVEYHFHKIMDSLAIRDANFHCLRHTFATRCVAVGFDVKTLSVILGHAAIHITMNRYVHPTADMKRQNMDKLEGISNLFAVSENGQNG